MKPYHCLIILLLVSACNPSPDRSENATGKPDSSVTKGFTVKVGKDSVRGSVKVDTALKAKAFKTKTKADSALAATRKKASSPTTDPDPDAFSLVDKEAVPLNMDKVQAAIHPASDIKTTGTVYLKVLVDEKGHYRRHIVRQSPDPALTEATVAGAKQLLYSPAKLGDKPIKEWVAFQHEFK